jgi:hypothetical protein
VNGFGFKNIANYNIYLAEADGLNEKDAFIYGEMNSVETVIDYSIGRDRK